MPRQLWKKAKKLCQKSKELRSEIASHNKEPRNEIARHIKYMINLNKLWTQANKVKIIASIGGIGAISMFVYDKKREVYNKLKGLNKSYKKDVIKLDTKLPKVSSQTELDLLQYYYNRSIR